MKVVEKKDASGANSEIPNGTQAHDSFFGKQLYSIKSLKKLREEIKYRSGILEALHSIATTRDLGEMQGKIVSSVAELLGVENVRLYEKRGDNLVCIEAVGWKAEEAKGKFTIKRDDTKAAWIAVNTKKPVFIKDATNDPRADPHTTEVIGHKSFISVPVCAGDEVLGIVVVDNKGAKKRLTEGVIPPIELFCAKAAPAMRNALLDLELTKKSAEIAKKSEELNRKNKVIEELTAFVSHEIKNALIGIGGLARLLLPKAVDEVSKNYLSHIVSSVLSAELFVKNILDEHARKEGKLPLQLKPMLLSELLELAVKQVADPERRISSSCAQADIYVDESLMSRAVANLLLNALKYSPKDKPVLLSGTVEDKHAVIKIKDSGEGIPAEELPIIFEKYGRGSSGMDGTGLGLYLAKKIVELHYGSIGLQSDAGTGTEFTIKFFLLSEPHDVPSG